MIRTDRPRTSKPIITEASDIFAAVDEDGGILEVRTFAYDELARLWYRRNWEHEAAGLVVLDLAYDEYADVGDFLDIDKDGVATLR